MHSQLDCHLKPDLDLLKQAREEILREGKVVDQEKFDEFWGATTSAIDLIEREKNLAGEIKKATDSEEKERIKQEKDSVTGMVDDELERALVCLTEAGGGDAYHYNYDLHFNRLVAGLMGSTCYMKETFDELQAKRIKNILAIASRVEGSGHHSTFGHSHLTLEITGIPKALAMVLNNEKEYCTSEKSARYTVMNEIEPTQLDLYSKWKEIFAKEIDSVYGNCRPFFDAKGVKVQKLAQENARYMISVFTPSNMVYTTSFRQLNYLVHWFEQELADLSSNSFYAGIRDEMKEFVQFVKDNNLYSELLEDHKGRGLTLFGHGILKNYISSNVYSIGYNTSLACLAQEHRHRTIHYHINEFLFEKAEPNYFVPPILKCSTERDSLVSMWKEDISKVAQFIPQGRLVSVVENGETQDFLLKAFERDCAQAQWEIMDLTRRQAGEFSNALKAECEQATQRRYPMEYITENSSDASSRDNSILEASYDDIIAHAREMQEKFEKLSKGARCTAGYDCQDKCGFKEGINLDRKI